MAKKQETSAKSVETPIILPDFYIQIMKGTFGITLSETDGKLNVKFVGIDTIYTVDELHNLQVLLDNVIQNLYDSSDNIEPFGEFLKKYNTEEASPECECHNGPCYCCES